MLLTIFALLLGHFVLVGGGGGGSQILQLTKETFNQGVSERSHFVMFYSSR